jgi:uncharacterized protein YlxW (UPF0749 family)
LAWRYNDKLPRVIAPAVPYLSLEEMETVLEAKQTDLKQQISKINDQVSVLDGQVRNRQSGMKGLVDEADRLKTQAGLTEVSGAGVKVVLNDSDSGKNISNAIAHASDLRDLVNQLWANGAQAISIKGAGSLEERIGPTTSIECIVSTVLINGTKMVPPFEIEALGDPSKLKAAIQDKNALKSIYDRTEKEGLEFAIDDSIGEVSIPSFTGNIITEHVKVK